MPTTPAVSLEKTTSVETTSLGNTPASTDGEQYEQTQIGQSPYAGVQYPAAAGYPGGQYAGAQQQNAGYAAGQYPAGQYASGEYAGGPPTGGYPGYSYGQPPRSGGGGRAVLLGIAIACVIGLAVAAVFVWLKVADSGDDASTTAQPDATTQQQQPQQQTTTVTSTAVDPEVSAGESLRGQAATDAADMRTMHNNQWAAQISSKRLGLVAEGTTWNNAAIWSEFESSRARYPQVKLLNSNEWPVFSEPGWWITVSAQNFPSPESALVWCRSVGLDKDHCFAKLVSDSRGPQGTTLYQR